MSRYDKYTQSQAQGATVSTQGRYGKYVTADQEREKIIASYAEDIIRRNTIYGGIPQAQLQDPDRLYRLAAMEAERAGFKPPQVEKQSGAASIALGYGQGGLANFAEELSGAVDFVGGTAMGIARGEGFGAIDSGKQAYSKRVEADRRLLRQAEYDNPELYLGGQILGSVVTTAPMPASWVGAGARTTGQVALQTADKAAKLQKLSQAATGTKAARLAAKSAALSAKSAKLALPAQTVGQAAGRFGARFGEGALKGVGYGAAYGGLYGAGAAEGSLGERLDEAATGAAFGGAFGGVLSPAVQFIAAPIVGRIGYGMLTSADNKALDIIIKRAERSGTSLQKVQQDFDAWNKTGEVPETLAELMGPNERSLLSALITVNRETREQATDVFVGRGRGEVNRLEDAFAKSFGASRKDYQATKAAAAQARAKEAEPFYEGAYVDATTGQRKFLGQQETDALVYEIGGSRVAQSTLSTASDYADALGKRAIRDEIDDFAAAMQAGRPVKPLSVEAADYIERGINRRYGAASRGEAQDIPAGLRGLRDRVRTIIDPSGLGDARATAKEAIRRGELLEEGLDIMLPTVDVDDVTRVMGGVPDLGIPPASAEGRKAYGVGASRAIGLKLRETPDMRGFADATQKVARSPSLRDKLDAARPKDLVTDPAILNIQKKLDAGKKLTAKQQRRLDQFGKQFAEKQGSAQTRANAELDQAIERAAARAQFGVDMVGNSRTAFRQGDVEDALLDDAISTQVGQSLSDLLITGVGGAGNQIRDKLARTIGNRLGQPSIYRPQINRAAANVLLATGDEIPKQIARLAARAASRRVSRITMRGLPPPPGSTPPRTPRPPSGGSSTPSTPIAAGGFAGFGRGYVDRLNATTTIAEAADVIARSRFKPAKRMERAATADDWTEATEEAADILRVEAQRQGGNDAAAQVVREFSPDSIADPKGKPRLVYEDLAAQILRSKGIDPEPIYGPMKADRLTNAERGVNAKLMKQAKGEAVVNDQMIDEFGPDIAAAERAKPPTLNGLGLRTDLGAGVGGALFSGAMPMEEDATLQDRLQRAGTGFLLGYGASKGGRVGARMLGRNALAGETRTAGVPKTPGKSKLGTRAADVAAIGALAGAPPAEADTGRGSAELDTANERVSTAVQRVSDIRRDIAALEEDQRLMQDPKADPTELQTLLQRRGLYKGPIDGKIQSGSIAAIEANRKQTMQDIEAKRRDLANAEAEEAAARRGVKDANMRAALKEAEPNQIVDMGLKVGQGAAFLAAMYGTYRLRGKAVKAYEPVVKAAARKANSLVNTNPVKTGKTAPKSGENALSTRAANINEFWKMGGAGKRVPFETDAQGNWSERTAKDIFGRPVRPVEASQLFKAPRYLPGDVKFMLGSAVETAGTKFAADKAAEESDKAEADMQKALEAGDDVAFNVALNRKKMFDGTEAFFRILERIGYGAMAGSAVSGLVRYPGVAANVNKADAERAALLQAMAKQKPATNQGQRQRNP